MPDQISYDVRAVSNSANLALRYPFYRGRLTCRFHNLYTVQFRRREAKKRRSEAKKNMIETCFPIAIKNAKLAKVKLALTNLQMLGKHIAFKRVKGRRTVRSCPEESSRFQPEMPPMIYYPSRSIEDHQLMCRGCYKSKEFFKDIGKKITMRFKCLKQKSMDGNIKAMEKAQVLRILLAKAKTFKLHEIKEFRHYVCEVALTIYADSHPYKLLMERWNRLKHYLAFMEFQKMKFDEQKGFKNNKKANAHSCLEVSQSISEDKGKEAKTFREFGKHMKEGRRLYKECERTVEQLAIKKEAARIQRDPVEFYRKVEDDEAVFFYRICNCNVVIAWLEHGIAEYSGKEDTDFDLESDTDSEEETAKEWESICKANKALTSVKFCNARRRQRLPLKPTLPSTLSHLAILFDKKAFKSVHPSWYHLILNREVLLSEYNTLADYNMELEKNIWQFEQEIQDRELKIRVKDHVHTVMHKQT